MRIAGGLKGQAVLTRCPVNGPFTNIEQEAIQSAVDEAFANGELEEHQYLLTWLLLALGQRPSQYAALKVCDLSQSVSSDGVQSFTLMVPRAKQRNKSRESFTARSLIPQIGLPLWQYAQRVRERFSSQLPDAGQAPMFPEKQLSEHATGFEFHCTTKALSQSFRSALEKLCVFSERTGEPMAITPRRFRRTFGTRLAQEGHGVLQIAELLDHTDTQNVGVYVAATPEIAARIDRAVAMEMAPLAQAFKGILIADESLASRGHNPSSRIRDLRIDRSGKPMGSCGQHSFCGFLAPISCYTCQSFEPWLDGPHEAVLAYLLDRREKGLGNLGDRMVSINDRTILAVAEVIQRCVDIRAEDANAQR
jgi:hypothetical protein